MKNHLNKYIKSFSQGAVIGMILSFLFFLILMGYVTFGVGEFSFLYYFLFLSVFILSGLVISIFIGYFFSFLGKTCSVFVGAIFSTFFLLYLLPYRFFSIPFVCFELACGGIAGIILVKGKGWVTFIAPVFLFLLLQIPLIYLLGHYTIDNSIKITSDYRTQSFQQLTFDDPSLYGPYQVKSLFYGNGEDKNRSEFKDGISLKTHVVDATPFFNKTKGFQTTLRRYFWGFDASAYPLNAQVWYPEGEGIFPLVMIVHGNHNMGEYSEAGYQYLGRLLASKGYITVTVDENFLNKGFLSDYYNTEIFVRGWLLLKHLECWREWNQQADNIFSGKVDMNNIALIGHSRGGNAVGLAAIINKHEKYYGDDNYCFDFNFSIKGVIQIAPGDNYEFQSGVPIVMENVDLLTLQGANDYDIPFFLGNRFYNRTRYTDNNYHFKSLLYINNANHSQFNTVWGSKDLTIPLVWLINPGSIMTAEKQRKVTEIYIYLPFWKLL